MPMLPRPTFSTVFALAATLSALAGACTQSQTVTADGRENEQRSADASVSGEPWRPNDLSILWPAPESGELPAGYLKLYPKAGERGPYFPREQVTDLIGPLHGDFPLSLAQEALVVVAMRVDPCAASSTATACVRELRLSAETLAPNLADAALHLVYRLPEETFEALLSDLDTWRSSSPAPVGSRLSVHPGLAAAGLSSSFAEQLHDIVIRYATEDALVRITSNQFAFDNWSFHQFDKLPAGWTRSSIPGLPETEKNQAWIRQAGVDSLTDPSGTITPAPARSMAALHHADALAHGTSNPEVLEARDNVLYFENPKLSHAENTDCVSCHMANQTHRWAEAHAVSFDAANRYEPPPGADPTVDVPAPLRGNLGSTIAFGYHRITAGDRNEYLKLYPEISARVVHETAEAVARLNSARR